MRTLIASALLLLLVPGLLLADVRMGLQLATNTTSVPLPDGAPWHVVFEYDPIILTVEFALAHYPGGDAPSEGIEFSSAQWWNDIDLTIVDPGGRERPLVPVGTQPIPGKKIASDLLVRPQTVIATRLILPKLAPGQYTVNAEFRELSSTRTFRVVTGAENDSVRVEALRRATPRAEDFAQAKELYLEIAALRPGDAWPWLELGLRAMNQASMEEAREYLREAIVRVNTRVAHPNASHDRKAAVKVLLELEASLPLIYRKRDRTYVSRGPNGAFVLVNRETHAVERVLTKAGW